MSESVVTAGFTEKLGTGKILKAEPEAICLAPEQTALIVIDMQNAIPRKAAIWIWRALMSQRPSQWLKY